MSGWRGRTATARVVRLTVAFGFLAGCTGGGDDAAPSTPHSAPATSSATVADDLDGESPASETSALGFRGIELREGQGPALAAEVALLEGTPLDSDAVAAVVERIPPLDAGAAEATTFSWPAETLTRPQGEQTGVPFPAGEDVDALPATPEALEVLRVQPTGDVALAPFLAITFNQPMVPAGTVDQLTAAAVPVTVTPAIEGRWSWVGTSTLRFDAAERDRLPMATDYTMTVPAGTRSTSGAELTAAVEVSISTPAAEVQGLVGDGRADLPLQPVLVATFDQDVDAESVLAQVTVTADGAARDVRVATADEIAADDQAQATVAGAVEGRVVAFTPVEPFATDQAIEVTFAAGIPSREGRTVSAGEHRFSMRTFAPLRVTGARCWQSPCRPGDGVEITFNNELDAGSFDPAAVGIDPAVGARTVGQHGNVVIVQGAWLPDSTYRLTVPAGLADVFGQALGAPDTREIDIGPARPFIRPFEDLVVTVDPSAEPAVPVVTVGHEELRVTVWAADPDDWAVTASTLYRMGGGEGVGEPDWPVLRDGSIDVGGDPDAPVETSIDLSDLMPDGHGQVIVRIESVREFGEGDEDFWSNRPTVAWVQGTDLGVDVVADTTNQHVWVTDLATGTPIAGVTVGDTTTGDSVTTDADGLAVLALSAQSPGDAYAVTATRDGDVALLPGYRVATPEAPRALWHVVDDRGTYRPGETVRIKGWVRGLSADRQLQAWDRDEVGYAAFDGYGAELTRGTAEISPAGSFTIELDLPAGAGTGVGRIALDEGRAWGTTHELTIAEYRPPDFEVTTSAGTGPHRRGEPIAAAAQADYYTGGPLGEAAVTWQVTTSEATYAPPGWDRFDFGRWVPWWSGDVFVDGASVFESAPCCGPDEAKVERFTGRTDASGAHHLDLRVGDLDPDLDGLPVTVRANAAVQDVNRQVIAGTTDLLVHPADLYVGLGGDDTFVRQGEDLTVDAIVTDIDGAALAGRRVDVVAGRTNGRFVDGTWTDELLDVTRCTVTSATEPVPCTLIPPAGGTYRITATVTDDAGRFSRSETTRWVSGVEVVPSRTVRGEALTLVPDAEEYRPGQTAQLLVQAPFASGTGLIVTDRGPVMSTRTFDVVDGSAIVPVEISEDDVPNVNVSIEVAGSTPRAADDGGAVEGGPQRPAFATGAVTLPVSTASRTLDVTVTPAEEQLAPGAATTLDVDVTAPDGVPVAGADLLVMVVDEAVLALSGYDLDDPASSFYAALPSDVAATYGRDGIVLVDPETLLGGPVGGGDEAATEGTEAPAGAAPAAPATTVPAMAEVTADAAGRAAAPAGQAVTVRSNFDAVALFAPDVTTDATGTAAVDVLLPDNLTRYRVMVVAASGTQQFGTGEANVTAELPLMVRPAAPRFLNFGDRVELPVVVQNNGDAPLDADVVVESANLGADVPAGVRVAVPANDRVEVRFPLAAEATGRGTLRVTAVSGDRADSATVSLPVYTPATSETFATYGELDSGAVVQPVLAPTDVIPQFGGLEVSTSSTTLQTLTDSVLYLTDYRYASSDGLGAQLLAISSLRDVLDAFNTPELASAAEIDAAMDGYIAELTAMQNDDGGFPSWLRGRPSEAFNTIHATHALIVSRDAGYAVPPDAISRGVDALGVIEQLFDPDLDEPTRWTLRAYALHVRARAGQADAAAARALYAEAGDELPLDALAWLWPVIDDGDTDSEIEQRLADAAVDTAGAVTFTTGITEDGAAVTLASDRRTDGLILDALLALRPGSDLVPKIVRGLQAGQGADGRWDNVQENAFILLAVRHYFDAFEGAAPDFVTRVWVGERYASGQEFTGRSTTTNVLSIPTADVITAGDAAVTLGHEGTGRLYYRIGLRTAPASLDLAALDRGFVVARTYEAVDDPADVIRDADGTWRIRAGARVRVRLTMVAESQRAHVALVDPLPAGLEIVNPTLATSQEAPVAVGGAPEIGRAETSWWGPWFDHQNVRDDRAEAFAGYLGAGVYDYSYIAQATMPGEFVVPPARAEEIYAPETFGRAATDRVVVG